MRPAVSLAMVLCFALGCSAPGRQPDTTAISTPAPKPTALPSVLPSTPPPSRIVLYGAAFRLPEGCIFDCNFEVDAHSGDIRCSDLPESFHYVASLSVTIARALEPGEAAVEGRSTIGNALLYWGQGGPRSKRWYCEILTYPAGTADVSVDHQFCTESRDRAVRARIREIALTYEDVGPEETQTVCEYD